MKLLAGILALACFGCDGSDAATTALEARLALVESRLAAAELELAAIRLEVDRHESVVSDFEAQDYTTLLAFLAALTERVEITADGDILVFGANLLLRPSLQFSAGDAPNGKGNLVFGFEEPQRLRCVGGQNANDVCEFSGDCESGACEDLGGRDKSGTSNLILGGEVTYAGSGSIITGVGNSALASGVIILGGTGVVANTPGEVIVAP